MSWPSIAKCYDEIVEDPSPLGLFSEKESTSPLELPVVASLWFRLISEMFFPYVAPYDIWGKTGVEFVTDTGLRVSDEATPTVILITDGVEEGYLGMVTTFCHHDQVKMELQIHFLPFANVTHQSLAWLWWGDIPIPLHTPRNFQASLPWHKYSFWGHFLSLIPSGLPTSMEAGPIF